MDLTQPKSKDLLLTPRCKDWLTQFDARDQETAKRLVDSLTLVSHSAFERGLTKLIQGHADELDGPVALFASREIDPNVSLFQQAEVSGPAKYNKKVVTAIAPGSDVGSEARVAAMIRNIAKAAPSKFLNHPAIEEMRAARCRAIYIVDDFIGSGKRVREFLTGIWNDASIRSWHSLKYIRLFVLAYSATDKGLRVVQRAPGKPRVDIVRGCPTIHEMPWPRSLKRSVTKLCQTYGVRTSRPKMVLGFADTMATLVFEHGSPNNVPAILWASQTDNAWIPLFPGRTVLGPEASAFPPEITRRDPSDILRGVGQKRLAGSGALSRRGEAGATILVVLGLLAKGVRRTTSVSYATGLSREDCARILERCVKWGFVTTLHRVTAAGLAELRYAKSEDISPAYIPPKGEDDYYPKKLRGATGG